MDGEQTINGRAFAAFGLAAICIILAIFVLSYTLRGSEPEAGVEAMVGSEVPAEAQ